MMPMCSLKMPAELKNLVVVFDLDDTLYREADYRMSGVKYICELLNTLYNENLDVEAISRRKDADILGYICTEARLSDTSKESLLWAYRLHQPTIALDPTVRSIIEELALRCRQVAILTDGRSVTQRLKIKALGLEKFPVYISEEHASTKPCPKRFIKIREDYPEATYLYIADNPKKDFLAPRRLGWKTIGLLGPGDNIHSQSIAELDSEFFPDRWIDNLEQVLDILC